MLQFIQQTYFNNTVLEYLLFLAYLIASILVIKIVEKSVIKRITAFTKKTKQAADDTLITVIKKNLVNVLYFLAFYFSTKSLVLSPAIEELINTITFAFTIAICASLISTITVFYINKHIDNKMNDVNNILLLRWIRVTINTIIWCIALILFFDNIGVKITSLITGLGVGGIALAFAAQNILVDIFCFFTILFDKPFEIGDFIIAGDQMGNVEHIGMKTTRLRALNGEQVVCANSDLTKSRINNFKTMEERRVLFRIGVTYDTPYEKLKEIPELIKSLIGNVPDVRFGRTHFCNYGPYSLDFEIAYYVLSSDYDKYMDINQEINYKIKEEFDGRGIEFAFPTQTLHVNNLSMT